MSNDPKGPPVVGIRDRRSYAFAEDSVAQKTQLRLLEAPKLPPELPQPSKLDPNLDQTKIAIESQLAGEAISSLPYGKNPTRWFRFSPMELFMEQVLARRLWTVE